MKTAPRYALDFPVALMGLKEQLLAQARSANLSLSGIGLEFNCPCPFKAGDEVRVTLQLEDAPDAPVVRQLEILAKIAWAQEARCGLEIIEMPEETRMFYEDLLSGFHTLLEFTPARCAKVDAA